MLMIMHVMDSIRYNRSHYEGRGTKSKESVERAIGLTPWRIGAGASAKDCGLHCSPVQRQQLPGDAAVSIYKEFATFHG